MNYRLALYSDQEHSEYSPMDSRLMNLIGVEKPNVGYVASSPDPERIYLGSREAFYATLGAELTTYVDSENCKTPGVMDTLLECDAIHLSGGNTFEFLAWLKQSGLITELERYAQQGGVLVGVSAGAIIMTPSIKTSLLCGDIAISDGDYRGLGLVPFNFWPHYQKGEEASSVARQVLSSVGLTYGCPDGSGLIVDGEQLETYGDVYFDFTQET